MAVMKALAHEFADFTQVTCFGSIGQRAERILLIGRPCHRHGALAIRTVLGSIHITETIINSIIHNII